MCLIRSFLPHRKFVKGQPLELEFADYAITALILDKVFVESLHKRDGREEQIRRLVEEVSVKKQRAVSAKDVTRRLGVSLDQAYALLRRARKAGLIRQANKPEKNNQKLFLSMDHPRFVPDPHKLFQELDDLGPKVSFVHPKTKSRYQSSVNI